MDFSIIKDVAMFSIALYGAILATYSYRRNRVKFELDTSLIFMVLEGENDKLKTAEVLQISILNKGLNSCFVEKIGFVNSQGKFFPLDIIEDVGKASEIQPNFRNGEIESISRTNSSVGSLAEDKEVKPNYRASAFFDGKGLRSMLERLNENKVYAYVKCSGTEKRKILDYSKASK